MKPMKQLIQYSLKLTLRLDHFLTNKTKTKMNVKHSNPNPNLPTIPLHNLRSLLQSPSKILPTSIPTRSQNKSSAPTSALQQNYIMLVHSIIWLLLGTAALGQVAQLGQNPFNTSNSTNNPIGPYNQVNIDTQINIQNPRNNNNNQQNGSQGGSASTVPPVDVPAFNFWMGQYGSKFGLSFQDPFRAIVFNQNIQKINNHNANPANTYKMGINQFILLTQAEFERFALGDITDRQRQSQPTQQQSTQQQQTQIQQPQIQNFPTRRLQQNLRPSTNPQPTTNPRPITGQPPISPFGSTGSSTFGSTTNTWGSLSWDWRKIGGAVTPVKDQGGCAACYAFAAVAVVQSMHMIANALYLPDLSEQQIIDCTANYNNQGCNGGYRFYSMNYIQDYGLVTEDVYPYRQVKQNCIYSAGSYKVSTVSEHNGCEAIRKAVRRGPVAVGVDAKSWAFYSWGVLPCYNNQWVDHAVVVVGYDSAWNWIVKNSWGTTWGEGGYITVDRYADCMLCQYAGVSANVL